LTSASLANRKIQACGRPVEKEKRGVATISKKAHNEALVGACNNYIDHLSTL